MTGMIDVARACVTCGAAYVPRAAHQIYCRDGCRVRDRTWAKRSMTDKMNARARNRRWREAKTGRPVERNPWLVGAPPFETHLPGGGFTIDVEPLRWPIELRNARLLHGLVTNLLDVPHEQMPPFVLMPWRTRMGWAVYVRDATIALPVAGRAHRGVLADQQVTVTCGPLIRPRTPVVDARGRRVVQIDTITPVHTRQTGAKIVMERPTDVGVRDALVRGVAGKIGLFVDQESVCVRIVESAVDMDTVHVGGKYGVVRGWAGRVTVEANAPARWLLKIAEIVGFGGRCGLGFGRVRVSDAAP